MRSRPPTRWVDSTEQDSQILEIKLEDHSGTQEQLRKSEHDWVQVPQKKNIKEDLIRI
jgi:hypothetical protein